jgi:hypothetical protein
MSFLARFKALDVYRDIPKDLKSEATLTGAIGTPQQQQQVEQTLTSAFLWVDLCSVVHMRHRHHLPVLVRTAVLPHARSDQSNAC